MRWRGRCLRCCRGCFAGWAAARKALGDARWHPGADRGAAAAPPPRATPTCSPASPPRWRSARSARTWSRSKPARPPSSAARQPIAGCRAPAPAAGHQPHRPAPGRSARRRPAAALGCRLRRPARPRPAHDPTHPPRGVTEQAAIAAIDSATAGCCGCPPSATGSPRSPPPPSASSCPTWGSSPSW